jgi:hypothetical protein
MHRNFFMHAVKQKIDHCEKKNKTETLTSRQLRSPRRPSSPATADPKEAPGEERSHRRPKLCTSARPRRLQGPPCEPRAGLAVTTLEKSRAERVLPRPEVAQAAR